MLQEEQRTIRNAGKTGAEATTEAEVLRLLANWLRVALPVHAVGRIGQDEVELLRREGVRGEGVAIAHATRVDVLHHQVGLGNRPRLVIEFLAGHHHRRARVEVLDALHAHHQHAARAGGRIVDGADRALGVGEFLRGAALDQQVGDQANHLARRVVLTSRLIAHFGELPQKLLEDVAHRLIADHARTQVQVGEVGHHLVQDPGTIHARDLVVEVVRLDDRVGVGRELANVGGQIVGQVLVVVQQRLEGQRRRVVEALLGRLLETGIHAGRDLDQAMRLRDHGILRRCQHLVHAAQDQQGEHDRAVLVLLEGAPELVGHSPDECDLVLKSQRGHASSFCSEW